MKMKSLKLKTAQDRIDKRVEFLVERSNAINFILSNIDKINQSLTERKILRNTECLLSLSRMQADLLHCVVNMKVVTRKMEEKIILCLVKHATYLIDINKNEIVSINDIKQMRVLTNKIINAPTNFVNLQPHDNNYD